MKGIRNLKIGVILLIILLVSIQFLFFQNSKHYSSNPLDLKIFHSEVTKAPPVQSASDKIVTVTRWILSFWPSAPALIDSRIVKERTDILLRLRKLVIFSLRAVNQRLAGTGCVHWWVNPLTVSEFQQKEIQDGMTEFNLTFELHPGKIPFQSVVRLRREKPNSKYPYPSDDLFYVDATRLDRVDPRLDREPTACRNLKVPSELLKLCLCPEEKENADTVTLEIRQQWNKTDPELPSWPPNVSMSVPDYIEYGTMNLYPKSPNKTEFCGSKVKMLLFISSAPSHFRARASIRNTFGNFSFLKAHGVRLLFLFGIPEDMNLQKRIDDELLEENDIVQADYADSYHNLSLSHLSMYNWIVTHCKGQGSPPPWILKADDDFFLNVPLALDIVKANPEAEMIGCLFCGTPAIRSVDYMTKYYVPRYMYAPDYYVGYVSGVAYLVRTDVLEPILKASLTTPLIHMDDAYVMGLLTRDVGIRPRQSQLISYGKGNGQCDIRNQMSSYITNATLEEMWIQYEAASVFNCKVTDQQLKVDPMTPLDHKDCLNY